MLPEEKIACHRATLGIIKAAMILALIQDEDYDTLISNTAPGGELEDEHVHQITKEAREFCESMKAHSKALEPKFPIDAHQET